MTNSLLSVSPGEDFKYRARCGDAHSSFLSKGPGRGYRR